MYFANQLWLESYLWTFTFHRRLHCYYAHPFEQHTTDQVHIRPRLVRPRHVRPRQKSLQENCQIINILLIFFNSFSFNWRDCWLCCTHIGLLESHSLSCYLPGTRTRMSSIPPPPSAALCAFRAKMKWSLVELPSLPVLRSLAWVMWHWYACHR